MSLDIGDVIWPLKEKGKPISLHKERKVAVHTTIKGKGKVRRALERKRAT